MGVVDRLRRLPVRLEWGSRGTQFWRTVQVSELHDIPDALDPHTVYIAGTEALPKWAVLLCPCPEPHRVTLSLQPTHRFYWRVGQGRRGPTIRPSIDIHRDRRCHYWILDGDVRWVPGHES